MLLINLDVITPSSLITCYSKDFLMHHSEASTVAPRLLFYLKIKASNDHYFYVCFNYFGLTLDKVLTNCTN